MSNVTNWPVAVGGGRLDPTQLGRSSHVLSVAGFSPISVVPNSIKVYPVLVIGCRSVKASERWGPPSCLDASPQFDEPRLRRMHVQRPDRGFVAAGRLGDVADRSIRPGKATALNKAATAAAAAPPMK